MSSAILRCSLGDLAVLGGDSYLRLPSVGTWSALAEAHADAGTPVEGSPASFVLRREDGTEDALAGTVRRSRVVPGQARLVVALAGGKGKLLEPLAPRDFAAGATPLHAGLVAAQLVADAGELLADAVETALDAYTLPRWHRARDTSGAVSLDLLVAELARRTGLDFAWRFLPSGKMWIGVETWPAGAVAQFTAEDPDDGRVIYAPTPTSALLEPGTLIDSRQAREVFYGFEKGRIRAHVRARIAGDPPRVPELDLYRASYGAKVLEQEADGTLHVVCDDARIGEFRALPLRCGIPGAFIMFQNPDTERVRVSFEGASPAGAYAEAHDQDVAAAKGIARVSDGCGRLIYDQFLPGIYYSPSATAPYVLVAPNPQTPLPPDDNASGTPVAIAEGSAEVKIR